MTELERFKRRLIRSVARMLIREKKSPAEVWSHLSKETGRDTKELWKRMSVLCLKKLSRLLCGDDYVNRVGRVARMSLTDWLMFDMVLVHDKPDVCSTDMSDTETKLTALEDLFALVQKFNIEELSPDSHQLAETWAELALKYNENGRECSPMLLQLRWYQMKETTRSIFYTFWYKFRGNMRNLSEITMPTSLQSAIAKRFPSLITSPFATWEEMIERRRVVLFDQFKVLQRTRASAITKMFEGGTFLPPENVVEAPPTTSNEPDLVLVEPKIDVITLDDNSDDEKSASTPTVTSNPMLTAMLNTQREQPTPTIPIKYTSSGVKIKEEPRDYDDDLTEVPVADGLSNVMILEATHVPTEVIDETDDPTNEQPDLDNEAELASRELKNMDNLDCFLNATPALELSDDMNDCILADSEVGNVGNVEMEVASGLLYDKKIVSLDVNTINSNENEEDIESDVIINPNYSNKIERMNFKTDNTEIEVIKNDSEQIKIPIITPITELPYNLEIIDDGIDLCDEDDDIISFNVEHNDVNEVKQEDIEQENVTDNTSDSSDTNGDVQETAKFDLKLMMLPVVFTTKLDHMTIFKNADYENVKTDEIINAAIVESKPSSSRAVNINIKPEKSEDKHVVPLLETDKSNEDIIKFEPQVDETSNDSNSSIPENCKHSITSSLFQKPRMRNYNSILLCKNPDFNTRLKRLSAGFFMSERNRQLFNACKPLTIDLHKSFEMKLNRSTIYLKSCEAEYNDVKCQEKVKKCNNQPVSVVPSALPAQCLINNAKTDISKLIPPPNTYVPQDNILQDALVAERKNKVINLPDIVKVRRINQHLLTAEVSPLQAWNSDHDETTKKFTDNTINIKKDDLKHVKEEASASPGVNNKEYAYDNADSKSLFSEKPLLSLEVSPLYLNQPPKAHHLQHIIQSTTRGPTVTCLNVEPVFNSEQDKSKKVTKVKRNPKLPTNHSGGTRPWYFGGPKRNPADLEKHDIDDSLLTTDALMKMLSIMGEQPDTNNVKSKDNNDLVIDLEIQNEDKNNKSKYAEELKNWVPKKKKKRKRTKKEETSKKNTEENIDITEQKVLSPREIDAQRVFEDELAVSVINPPKPKKKVTTRVVKAVSIIPSWCASLLSKKGVVTDIVNTTPQSDNMPTSTSDINVLYNNIPTLSVNKAVPGAEETLYTITKTITHDRAEISIQTDTNETVDKPTSDINLNTPQSNDPSQQNLKESENTTSKLDSSAESNYIIVSDGENDHSCVSSHIDGLIAQNTQVLTKTLSTHRSRYWNLPPLAPIKEKKKYVITCRSSLSRQCPLNLGDSQILLTTATFPPHMLKNQIPSSSGQIGPVSNLSTQQVNTLQLPGLSLPKGVNLILMPNGYLKAVLDDGIKFDTQKLQYLLESLQTQIPSLTNIDDTKINDKETEIITESTEKPLLDSGLAENIPLENTAKSISQDASSKITEGPIIDASNVDTPMKSSEQLNPNEFLKQQPTAAGDVLEEEVKSNLENNKDENVLAHTEAASEETVESDDQQSDETKETPTVNSKKSDSRDGAKKSILSDLMEMSGISSEDVQVEETPAVAPLPAVGTSGAIVLTQVTTVEMLKYARTQEPQFFKYNLKTGVVTRILVTIEKKKCPLGPPRPLPVNLNSVIDLTDNTESKSMSSGELNKQGFEGTICKNDAGGLTLVPKNDAGVYTLVSKSIPRIIRKRAEVRNRNKRMKNKKTSLSRHRKRKEKIEAKIYLDDSDAPMEEEYLVESDSEDNSPFRPACSRSLLKRSIMVNKGQSDSSDDEPLAKKVHRSRDIQRQDICTSQDANEQLTENWNDEASLSDQNSDECILGA